VQYHPSATGSLSSQRLIAGRQLQILQPRIGPQFEDSQQHRYFEVFCTDTCATLGQPFDNYVWSGLVLQACEQQPFVRDAILAIGALTKTLGDVQRLRMLGIAPKEGQLCLTMSPDHKQALELYGKAIKGMQKATSSGGRGTRTALIACLLVVCFEGLYASHVQAMVHAQNGVKLLHEWLREKSSPNHSLLSSPAPHVIEDELIHAFHRLDLQVLTYHDTRPAELHQSFKIHADMALKGMPSIFLSLPQARLYLDLTMRRSLHFLATALFAGKADELEQIGANIKSEGGGDLPGGLNSFSSPKDVPIWLLTERDKYLEEVLRWASAFDPLLKSFAVPDEKRPLSMIGARIMKMLSITAKIMLMGAFFNSELGYDSLLPEFTENTILAESVYGPLISARKGIVSFNFDPNVLPPMYQLLVKCRDRMLRRRVIRLLTSYFHREGPWDSHAIARTGTWIMKVEEDGIETEHIPDHRRARMTKFHVDSMNRKIQVRCYQRINPEDRDVIWKEAVLLW
jgi:hypothetical protein